MADKHKILFSHDLLRKGDSLTHESPDRVGSCLMFEEVSVYTMLESPLHRSLTHAASVTGPAVNADVTAIRVFVGGRFAHPIHVDARRLGLKSRDEGILYEWPAQRDSIFPHLITHRPPDGVHLLDDLIHRGSAQRSYLFGPIEKHVKIVDGLFLKFELEAEVWCLLAHLYCGRSRRVTGPQIHLHDRISQLVRRVVQDGYQLEAHCLNRQRLQIEPRELQTAAQLLAKLSRTERQVLSYLRTESTERQIASSIKRSPHTVHVHVKNIYRKLGVTSRKNLNQLFD